jgi:hypothetical protein
MTDTMERATRQLYRAVEKSAAFPLPPEECARIVRDILLQLRNVEPDIAEVGARAVALADFKAPDAAACFSAMCAALLCERPPHQTH